MATRKSGSSAGVIMSAPLAAEAAKEAANYWTEASMLAAEPYPLPQVPAESNERTLAGGDGGSIVSGSQPETTGRPPAEAVRLATQGGYDYPAPFTRFEVREILYQAYPWCTIGKVFFTQNGNNYVASASSLGNKAIWTAGHVVHAGNNSPSGWSTNMIFVPAYRDGNAPFGKWPALSLATRTLWYQKGIPDGLTEDMGGAILGVLNGKSISQVVGCLGFAYNFSRFQHWDSMGYPAEAPFNGQRMWDCEASYAYDGQVSGIPPMAIGCDLTGGCSGGPWIWQFQDGLPGERRNCINGHNSYRISNRPLEINSPFFDDRAKSLYDLLTA